MYACLDVHCAFVGRAITAGRAAGGAEPPTGKAVACTATAALLAAVAAGNAAVATAGVENVTCLAVAGRATVAAACGAACRAAAAASGGGLLLCWQSYYVGQI